MKYFKIFFLFAFAFALPLVMSGLSNQGREQARNPVRFSPTASAVQKANSVEAANFAEVPFMTVNYEQSASPVNFGFLRNGLSAINHGLYNSRPRTAASNADSWRVNQSSYVKSIYKPNIPNADYQSKSLTNPNKSSPLRR